VTASAAVFSSVLHPDRDAYLEAVLGGATVPESKTCQVAIAVAFTKVQAETAAVSAVVATAIAAVSAVVATVSAVLFVVAQTS
jgi:hypothetical protein